ncbi:MAG TPA: hypothetical protein DEA96_02335 [Leptospiraceae bacterium]|nr:hypothetical protein [Spirochaetaceae bacterium]HBS03773.1 hypothetical protein [Leptospiraceae bacterium]|tara:strand:+ start:1691 stop:2377 length:687 start_codon:yes stop_codon:yes gene_type:complete
MHRITLTIAGMPVGHPGEIALATVELAQHLQFILCESKRGAQTHLKRAGVDIPDERFVVFDKKTRPEQYDSFLEELIDLSLKGPVQLLLVSDAGMPMIEDPGRSWIQLAEENGFNIQVIGGPTAITSAIARAGLNGPFTFGGFPPREKKSRQSFFASAGSYGHTFGFYEAPHRVPDVPAELMSSVSGNPHVFIALSLGQDDEQLHRLRLKELKSLRLPKKPAVFLVYK